jgi:hypothetical protein
MRVALSFTPPTPATIIQNAIAATASGTANYRRVSKSHSAMMTRTHVYDSST